MPKVINGLTKIRTILSKEQKQILETAFVLMIPVVLTKVTGQLFTLILASFYGASDSRLNQFYIANTIPELLTTVLMTGALGTVVIPILISSKKDYGKEYFYKIYSSILNATLIVFLIISLILIVFAGQFIPAAINLVNPEIPPTEAELNNITNMMRALLFPQLLLGISVFMSSGLNIYDRYILPQLSPLFFNIGRIAVILVLLPVFDYAPWVLVIGTYVGATLHLAIQIPLFKRLGIKYYPVILYKDKHIKEVLKLGLPRLFVLASDKIGFVISNFIAVAFIAGPASFNFAKSLYIVIPSLFGYTFSYSSYPTISRFYIEKNYKEIRKIVNKTLNEIFFLALPFVVTLMVLRVPLVRLLFGIFPDTQFTLDNTYQVAWILLFFSFGLIFITARWFVFNLFYAAKDTVTPAIISFGSLVGVIVFSVLFTNFLSYNPQYALSTIDFDINHLFSRAEPTSPAGIAGISLAISFVYTIEFFVILIVFSKMKINIGLKKLTVDLLKKFIAGASMFIFMYFTYKTWNAVSYAIPDAAEVAYRGSTTINLFVLTAVTVIPGFMVYYLVCYLFKVEELKILKKYLNPLLKIGGLKIK